MLQVLQQFNNRYPYLLLVLIVLLSVPFAIYAFTLANKGFTFGLGNIETQNIPLNTSGNNWSNQGLSLHLLLGAFLTLIIPLQVMLGWSNKAMKVHRWLGYAIVTAAVLTGLGGLTYIFLNGTIGGPVMNVAFATYGILMVLSAFFAARYARSKQIGLHQQWSMRLFVLAVGSWLYRLGYGMIFRLYPNMEVYGPNVRFRSAIDYFMDFSFFLLPLLGLELYFQFVKRQWHPILLTLFLIGFTAFFIYGFVGFFG